MTRCGASIGLRCRCGRGFWLRLLARHWRQGRSQAAYATLSVQATAVATSRCRPYTYTEDLDHEDHSSAMLQIVRVGYASPPTSASWHAPCEAGPCGPASVAEGTPSDSMQEPTDQPRQSTPAHGKRTHLRWSSYMVSVPSAHFSTNMSKPALSSLRMQGGAALSNARSSTLRLGWSRAQAACALVEVWRSGASGALTLQSSGLRCPQDLWAVARRGHRRRWLATTQMPPPRHAVGGSVFLAPRAWV